MNKPTKAKAKERLQRVLDVIPALQAGGNGAPNFTKWRRDTEIAIANAFGENSRHFKEFKTQQFYLSGLSRAAAILESMLDEIEEYWEDEEQEVAHEISQVDVPVDAGKVFLVHGRDHGTMNMVARFLEVLELEAVILQEQPNQGLTLVEKVERYAQVGFAVVLFTPDDIGALRDGEEEPKLRARQNVIFELGYLIAKLGRSNVTVLYKGVEGDIEIPSDYSGVLYTSLDRGDGWKLELIREMKSAGLKVDANRAFTI